MSRVLLVSCLALAACEATEPSGRLFSPAPVEVSPAAAPGEDLTFTEEPRLTLSSEEMAKGTVAIGTAAGVNADDLPVPAGTEALPAGAAAPAPMAAAPSVAAPVALGLPTTLWPVRLVSTIPQAQPPRAILGLPDGSERVVSPGSMVPEVGIVVMAVTADRVQLARVSPAGDHAAIESMEISAQYAAGPR